MNLSLRRGSFNQNKLIHHELNISKIFLKEKLENVQTEGSIASTPKPFKEFMQNMHCAG